MKYLALATDYDGTLATDGQVDAATLAALHQWKATGRKLILITGRRLDDFLNVFEHMELFDLAVVENGAVLYLPDDGSETLLGEAPPSEFINRLRDSIQRSTITDPMTDEAPPVPPEQPPSLATGRVIVATWTPHDETVRQLMTNMGLQQWQIIMNKKAVMILPEGVDKVAGLTAALQQLAVPAQSVVGVGDAENDTAFLQMCGLSAAVDNALAEVKAVVDWVAPEPRGAGVQKLIDYVLQEDRP